MPASMVCTPRATRFDDVPDVSWSPSRVLLPRDKGGPVPALGWPGPKNEAAHVDDLHNPYGHAIPHPLQFLASEVSSTHVPPHPDCPFGQHTPFDTASPLGQTHAPWLQVGAAAVHGATEPHCPSVPHVSTPLPMHCLASGTQA